MVLWEKLHFTVLILFTVGFYLAAMEVGAHGQPFFPDFSHFLYSFCKKSSSTANTPFSILLVWYIGVQKWWGCAPGLWSEDLPSQESLSDWPHSESYQTTDLEMLLPLWSHQLKVPCIVLHLTPNSSLKTALNHLGS